jgi:hypothetical protein
VSNFSFLVAEWPNLYAEAAHAERLADAEALSKSSRHLRRRLQTSLHCIPAVGPGGTGGTLGGPARGCARGNRDFRVPGREIHGSSGNPATADPNAGTIAALAGAALSAITSLSAAYFGIKVACEQSSQASAQASLATTHALTVLGNSKVGSGS